MTNYNTIQTFSVQLTHEELNWLSEFLANSTYKDQEDSKVSLRIICELVKVRFGHG